MSKTSDATLEYLKRKGGLPADFSLEPDYGGPKTTLEKLNEFILDLPANVTGELIPEVNPYERLTGLERRQLDASRSATILEAQEDLLEATQEEQEAKNTAALDKVREQEAADSDALTQRDKEILESQYENFAKLQKQASNLAVQQSVQQTQALFPYLDEAGRRGTERALDASQRFRAFKEQLPSSIQAIMASKQQQMQAASNAFATEAQAIANQQQAASGFAQLGTGRYAGRRIA